MLFIIGGLLFLIYRLLKFRLWQKVKFSARTVVLGFKNVLILPWFCDWFFQFTSCILLHFLFNFSFFGWAFTRLQFG